MKEKLKSFFLNDAIFYTILILLVSVVSFGLGRWSVLDSTEGAAALPVSSGIQLSEAVVISGQSGQGDVQDKPKTPKNSAISVVASKSGSKYHLPTCSGAKRIKEENKIYFDTIEQARAAGYTPAANCPGL